MLELQDVTVTAGSRTLVAGLDFTLHEAQRLVLVGPNGSGKSTLLRVLAGLSQPAGGSILRPASAPGMLFQEGALWPHMTVEGNLAFADPEDDAAWRRHLLQAFDLASLATRRPDALSGGEQVRLALARTLASRPRWVLLDEPLAHLDPAIRADVRERLPRELDALGAAAVTVTHHADDALLFGGDMLCLSGDGGWWSGTTRLALESPPNAVLAAFCERGTVLQARADGSGRAAFGLGLSLDCGVAHASVSAYLDAASVTVVRDGGTPIEPAGAGPDQALTPSPPEATSGRDDDGLDGLFIATDQRGGCWLRVGDRLLRSADSQGALHPGDAVRVRIVGDPRPLETNGSAP